MKVRMEFTVEVTDAQRVAIALHESEQFDPGPADLDENGDVITVPSRKADREEIKAFIETYGLAGLEGNLNDVLRSWGMEP